MTASWHAVNSSILTPSDVLFAALNFLFGIACVAVVLTVGPQVTDNEEEMNYIADLDARYEREAQERLARYTSLADEARAMQDRYTMLYDKTAGYRAAVREAERLARQRLNEQFMKNACAPWTDTATDTDGNADSTTA